MKGNVIGFDADTNTGAISGHDGKRYDFATLDWHAHGTPRHGDVVDFVAEGDKATQVYLIEPEYARPTFWQFLFSPSGRISRKQYWLHWTVPVLVIYIVLWSIIVAGAANGSVAAVGVGAIVQTVFMLVTLWPNIAVLVKRIHDRNKTGWLVLALYIPLALSYIATFTVGQQAALTLIFGVVILVVAIWFFVEFGCLRGTIGANRYGADPVPH
ncbi:MAG TPA: DUF805 domain-containing protein [Stellaceae bacterium]|nr:DUF805 domain-containing protein [Stellaceae bacterium]